MRYLAHGECLSHRPCKDCDWNFSLQYIKDHFPLFIPPLRGGQEGSGKQRSGQARLPYLWLLLAHYRLYCREKSRFFAQMLAYVHFL